MRYLKALLMVTAATLALVAAAASVAPSVIAQVQATLIRDVDLPARQVFRASKLLIFQASGPVDDMNSQTERVKITTVPAGRRFVIDHMSWHSEADDFNVQGEITRRTLRNSASGLVVEEIQINPPHFGMHGLVPSAFQDGWQQGPIYFEPGEEVWLEMTQKPESVSYRTQVRFVLHGHFVTL